jgi:putative ABC transport system permease protein
MAGAQGCGRLGDILPGMALFHPTFIRRQLTATRNQSAIFVLCVALSMVTLVALRGFGDSVDRALTRDARALIAGDLRLASGYPFAPELEAAVQKAVQDGRATAARSYEFYSVVRRMGEDGSLLSNLKVVEPPYPLYGAVTLVSGQVLAEVLTPGNAVAEQALLDRLNLQVGDQLRVGETTLTIADVVMSEPDRPVNFFALGPRLFVATGDLDALQLIKPGSRVSYNWALRTADSAANPVSVDALAADLRAVIDGLADPGLVRVDTFRTADTGIERFYRNFVFFLALVGIFTLLLAGIGIQSSLTAFLRERYSTIAIAKTVGATSRFVTANFYLVVLLLGGIGALAGMALGFALQWLLPGLLAGLLPPDIELVIAPRAVLESLVLGLGVVLVFTFLPLFRLEELRPGFIFRKEEPPITRWFPYVLTVAIIVALFTGLVIWQLGQVRTGLYFAGGAIALLLIAAGLAEVTLRLLRPLQLRNLGRRQALRGLFRPRNATRAIVITLSAALGVLFAIFLIEQNLRASFVQSYPPDAPNVFFLDIQPDQLSAFRGALGAEADYIPTVRAGLEAINGQPPTASREDGRGGDGETGQGDDQGREQNGEQSNGGGENRRRTPQYTLTYRDRLQPGESIVAGPGLFDPRDPGPQVSVLKETVDARGLRLGDTLTFNVQGVPVEATVRSVRAQDSENVQPFFSFVLQPQVLADAPQTLFTGLTVPQSEIADLQNRMVAQFPNITVIDATATIATFATVVDRITRVVRFFAAFSILAGLLIVVSSVYATRLARVQEAVYYKVLGATSRFVLRVFALENVFLGLISGLLALLMAQIAAWLIMKYLFELGYQPFPLPSVLLVVLTVLAVTAVGMGASISILRSRPILFLRQQGEEE